jgi:ABC-2 type transport system ATP-binding protein
VSSLLELQGLRRSYGAIVALNDLSFEVPAGQVVGFLGPNGAGKTTSIKMLMGLIAPTSGTMEIFGKRAPSPEVMARVGFLPENPYIYPYLSPREFITMCGRLSGMKGPALRDRVVEVIRRVGIPEAIDRAARALSKGMLQRVGLAAAIVHDPELLVLDEPMSGLDPVGRKEVRDLIVEEKHRGRTVFFSSHILSDVEMLCDRVCILRQGEVVVSGALRDLLGSGKRRSEITIGGASTALRDALAPMAHVTRAVGDVLVMEVDGDAQVKAVVERAFLEGARLESVAAKRETLEDLFVRRAL